MKQAGGSHCCLWEYRAAAGFSVFFSFFIRYVNRNDRSKLSQYHPPPRFLLLKPTSCTKYPLMLDADA